MCFLWVSNGSYWYTLSEIDPHEHVYISNKRPRAAVIYHSLRPRFGRNREIRRTSNRGECCKRHYTQRRQENLDWAPERKYFTQSIREVRREHAVRVEFIVHIITHRRATRRTFHSRKIVLRFNFRAELRITAVRVIPSPARVKFTRQK